MNTSTHTLPLTASKEAAFAFLSKIENLPKWATRFCKELKKDASGRDKIVTPQGEIFFRIEADPATGVIDMYGGPAPDAEAYWPARIVERPGNGSLFISPPCNIRASPMPTLPSNARGSRPSSSTSSATSNDCRSVKRQTALRGVGDNRARESPHRHRAIKKPSISRT